MKKAISVLSLLGLILGLVTTVVLVILGVYLVITAPHITSVPQEYAGNVDAYIAYVMTLGVSLLVVSACTLVSSILSIVLRTKVNNERGESFKSLGILNIVFGVLGGNECALAAGIVTLVYRCKGY